MRWLAGLFEPIESETPFGGRAVSWQARGSAWLKLEGRRRRERTEAGVTRVIEAATAEARVDARLIEGRMLRFGGGDWTIVMVETDDTRPGRMKLSLERAR
ncbi:MAG: phage head-tail adapter protein [Brevundimonas sp.]